MITATECQCHECQAGCTHTPGWFKPEELEPLAEYLDMSLQQVFEKYLGINYYCEDYLFSHTNVVAPAITTMTPGTVYPWAPFGTCVFYKSGKCSIHEVKPFECKMTHHSNTDKDNLAIRHEIVMAWLNNQDIPHKLLGAKPELPHIPVNDFDRFLHTLL